MLNKTYLGEVVTGLVIIAHSVPEGLTDANGDNIRDGLMQGLHDAADELELGSEADFNAQGAIADIVTVDREKLAQVQGFGDALAAALEELPRGDADD